MIMETEHQKHELKNYFQNTNSLLKIYILIKNLSKLSLRYNLSNELYMNP